MKNFVRPKKKNAHDQFEKANPLPLLLPSFAVGSNNHFPESGNESQSQPTGPFSKKADKIRFCSGPSLFFAG